MKQLLESRVCFRCGSEKTYVRKDGCTEWRYDKEGNVICKRCNNEIWRLEHPEYHKVYRVLNYAKELARDAANRALRQPQIVMYRQSHRNRQREFYKRWYIKNRLRRLEYCRRYNVSRRGI